MRQVTSYHSIRERHVPKLEIEAIKLIWRLTASSLFFDFFCCLLLGTQRRCNSRFETMQNFSPVGLCSSSLFCSSLHPLQKLLLPHLRLVLLAWLSGTQTSWSGPAKNSARLSAVCYLSGKINVPQNTFMSAVVQKNTK